MSQKASTTVSIYEIDGADVSLGTTKLLRVDSHWNYADKRVEAEAHADGDKACGRAWSCQCGTCKRAREIHAADIDRRFKRIEELQANLDRVRAVKATDKEGGAR